MRVLDHEFDHLAVFEHEGVAVDTVNYGVRAVIPNSEGGIERWDSLGYVSDVVDSESSYPIKAPILHGQSYAFVYRLQCRLAVIRYEICDLVEEVVQRVEGDLGRERLRIIVDEPRCCVTIEGRIIRDAKRWEQHVDIQCREDDKILARIVLGVDKYVPSLSGSQAQHFVLEIFWLGVDAINSDCSEVVILKPDGNTREIGHVDHVYQVGLSWLHCESVVLAVVDETCLWDWGLPSLDAIVGNIGGGLVVIQEGGHLLMIPIRKGNCHLFVEFERGIWVVDNQRSPQAVWILTLSV